MPSWAGELKDAPALRRVSRGADRAARFFLGNTDSSSLPSLLSPVMFKLVNICEKMKEKEEG